MDDGSILPWLFIVLLLSFAAYFSIAEIAFSSVSRVRLKLFADRGDRRAKRALNVLDNFDRAITTMLICTNVVQMAAAALITLICVHFWGLSFVAVTTIVTTFVIFFLAEMLPKSIAKKYSERLSLAVADSLYFFMRIFAPFSFLLTKFGAFLSGLTKGDKALTVTEEELIDIVENMTDVGELDAEKGELLQSAIMFADVSVESVITARVDIAAIDISASCDEILQTIKCKKHSRLPVYSGTIDNIVGILQIRKYLKTWLKDGDKTELSALLDEVCFVHGSTKIDELLPELNRKKTNLAVVTDNYGGTLGIVTVEDILEELVGEIWDEDDEIVELFIPLKNSEFELHPSLPVEEAFASMEFEDPADTDFDNKLMGEWVYENFDKIPCVGDSFTFANLQITVAEMRLNRIIKLKARILPQTQTEGAEKA